jgi:hypothetical protein
MATNKRDLKMFFRYDGNHRIIPGSNILSRKKPKVGRWTEIAADECCDPCTPSWDDAAAPSVVVTVDAVGGNPVTYYLVAFYDHYDEGGYISRSLMSVEVEFIVGDSTTSITINTGAFPAWANYIDYYISTTSGDYDELGYYFQEHDIPYTITLNETGDATYVEMIALPIHQVWNNCGSTTTTTTTTNAFLCSNILMNSGFENWTFNGREYEADNWDGTGIQEKAVVYEGNYSIYFDSNNRMVYQYFSPVNECSTIDLWYNTEHEDCAFLLVVRIEFPNTSYLQDDGTWTTDFNTIDLPSTNGEWENVVLPFDTSTSGWYAIEIGVDVDCGDAYFDNVKICDDCENPLPTTTTTSTTATPTTTTTTTVAPTTTTTTTEEVPSDRRLKSNIKPTGEKVGEFSEYEWDWNDIAKALGLDKYPNKGVLAQEVMRRHPDAVRLDADGYYRVNISKLVKK